MCSCSSRTESNPQILQEFRARGFSISAFPCLFNDISLDLVLVDSAPWWWLQAKLVALEHLFSSPLGSTGQGIPGYQPQNLWHHLIFCAFPTRPQLWPLHFAHWKKPPFNPLERAGRKHFPQPVPVMCSAKREAGEIEGSRNDNTKIILPYVRAITPFSLHPQMGRV